MSEHLTDTQTDHLLIYYCRNDTGNTIIAALGFRRGWMTGFMRAARGRF
jgi:hypothetical protein